MTQDQQLIKNILEANSTRAYRVLVEKYENKVFTICMKVLRNREEAEEIAQDVFVKGFELLPTLKDHSKFINWLLKIAYTKAIDCYRLKRINKVEINQVNESNFKQTDTPFVLATLEDRKTILNNLINKLEAEEAAIISLYYLQEKRVKEIVDITGLTSSNVKVKLFRARKSLRTLINTEFKHETKDLF